MSDRTMTPDEHAWRVWCAIKCAWSRLWLLENPDHITDADVGDGAADSAYECGKLLANAPSQSGEAAYAIGEAEAYLLGIRALNLIAENPQVTGEPDGWGYDTDRLDTAANWLHGALGDLVHNVEPWQWLERDDRLAKKRGAA